MADPTLLRLGQLVEITLSLMVPHAPISYLPSVRARVVSIGSADLDHTGVYSPDRVDVVVVVTFDDNRHRDDRLVVSKDWVYRTTADGVRIVVG